MNEPVALSEFLKDKTYSEYNVLNPTAGDLMKIVVEDKNQTADYVVFNFRFTFDRQTFTSNHFLEWDQHRFTFTPRHFCGEIIRNISANVPLKYILRGTTYALPADLTFVQLASAFSEFFVIANTEDIPETFVLTCQVLCLQRDKFDMLRFIDLISTKHHVYARGVVVPQSC